MLQSNKVSAELTEATKQQVLAALATIQNLLPFLITLTIEDRKRLRKMGAKSVEYVQMCYYGAKTHSEYMRANFSLPEYKRDMDLTHMMQEIQVAVNMLNEKVNDTTMAVKSDTMVASDESYGMLKQAAKKDGVVKALVDQISARYEGQSGKRAKAKKE
jgi:hypothetical protein